jgi:hypothetical protein
MKMGVEFGTNWHQTGLRSSTIVLSGNDGRLYGPTHFERLRRALLPNGGGAAKSKTNNTE